MNRSLKVGLALGGVALSASVLTLLAVNARAAGIPDANVLTYTGYLEGPDGKALTGEHSISVAFWASETATSDLCTGSLGSVELQSGRFQVPLPDECADAVKDNPNLFVDVEVDGASLGRTKLGAVPFAIEAKRATEAEQATESAHAAVAADADGALEERLSTLEAALPGDSGFRVINTTGANIPNGSPRTFALWDTEEFDWGNEFNPATDTFTSKAGGYYQINCTLFYVTGAGSYFMETGLVVNGKLLDAANLLNTGATHQPVRANTLLELAPGDTVQCGAGQSAGAARTSRSRTGFRNEGPSTFNAVRVKPLSQ